MSDVSLEDKIELIYEFNNNSPLFAKVAFILIDQKEFEKAIEILESGLQQYPDYPTSLIAYSLALANLGKKEQALSSLKKAARILDSEATENFYLEKINEVTKSLSNKFEPVKQIFKNDFDLGELAKKIEQAKIPKVDTSVPVDNLKNKKEPDFKIVSETMADIYYAQGNLIEALSMYEDLMKKNPDRLLHYRNKINEISKKLSE